MFADMHSMMLGISIANLKPGLTENNKLEVLCRLLCFYFIAALAKAQKFIAQIDYPTMNNNSSFKSYIKRAKLGSY